MPFILRTGLAVLLTALLFTAVPAAGASLAAADRAATQKVRRSSRSGLPPALKGGI